MFWHQSRTAILFYSFLVNPLPQLSSTVTRAPPIARSPFLGRPAAVPLTIVHTVPAGSFPRPPGQLRYPKCMHQNPQTDKIKG